MDMGFKEPALEYYPKMPPADFLKWEPTQEYNHQYAEEEIIAMEAASLNHNKISSNIIGKPWNYLQRKEGNISPQI